MLYVSEVLTRVEAWACLGLGIVLCENDKISVAVVALDQTVRSSVPVERLILRFIHFAVDADDPHARVEAGRSDWLRLGLSGGWGRGLHNVTVWLDENPRRGNGHAGRRCLYHHRGGSYARHDGDGATARLDTDGDLVEEWNDHAIALLRAGEAKLSDGPADAALDLRKPVAEELDGFGNSNLVPNREAVAQPLILDEGPQVPAKRNKLLGIASETFD